MHMLTIATSIAMLLAAGRAAATEYQVNRQPGLVYAEHDGTKLIGDLYAPKGLAKAPALVAIHGGGWQIGNRAFYQYWGPYLARNGYAVFSIESVGQARRLPGGRV